MKLTQKERRELKASMLEFANRVLNGENCTPQETASLYSVLDLLLMEDRSKCRRAEYEP